MINKPSKVTNIQVLEGAIKRLNELADSYVSEEKVKGRNPDDSIVIQSNRMYVMLLKGWLEAEKSLLRAESCSKKLHSELRRIRSKS